MKYYIIAGEASGDLHGSNLMKGIYAEDPQADIRFWGGDCMEGVWKDCEKARTEGVLRDRATPLAAGGGAHEVGGVVSTPHAPAEGQMYFVHQVASPEADLRLRIFSIYALHQVRTVEVS